MKKSITLFLLIGFLGINSNAQTDIVGTWKVEKVNTLMRVNEELRQKMEMLKGAFLKAKFEFKKDNNFSFHFEFEEMAMKDAHWKYNEATNSIIIQDWEHKDTDDWLLMEIIVKEEGGKILFDLTESFMILEVKKEE